MTPVNFREAGGDSYSKGSALAMGFVRGLTFSGQSVIFQYPLMSGCLIAEMKEGSMERRNQLSVVLNNAPGELAKLCDALKATNVNILAMSIQNAKDSVKELYKIREKTRRRIALAESYKGILKDSSDYSLIRLLVNRPEEAEKALLSASHLVDVEPVLVFRLVNQPGMLGEVVKRFGGANINIDYIYGSAMEDAKESIFVLHIAETDLEGIENSLRGL